MQIEVDPEDEWLLQDYKWFLNSGYPVVNFSLVLARLHHCIIGMPIDPDTVVDHKDRNKLNNRRANLHYTTRSKNYLNSSRSDKATCIYKQGYSGNFYVDITREQQRYYGGTYTTYEEAVVARDNLLKEIENARQHNGNT